MLDDLTTDGAQRHRNSQNLIDRILKAALVRLLHWRPQGSMMVAFPSGETLRFGHPDGHGEPWLRLRRRRALVQILRGGAIGFAEAYMDGHIECTDLTGLFRFYLRNRDGFERAGQLLSRVRAGDRIAHLLRRNSRRGSRRNISEHYDLGNDFYRLWLDPSMFYSSGLFGSENETLEAAQMSKLRRILDLLHLSGSEHILEIGCGWGTFAVEAATGHGATVTGLTLSHEQLAFSRERADRAGVGMACDFQLRDYRDATGSFDRIVSIEMIEAVGEAYWPRYFKTLNDRLKPGGLAVIQAITINEARFEHYRRSTDFIQRYIFPGGMLPTPTIIKTQASEAGLSVEHCEWFGQSYAETLREWRRRFDAACAHVAELGFDEHFQRRWRYYLAYCEAGFKEGALDVGFYRFRKPL